MNARNVAGCVVLGLLHLLLRRFDTLQFAFLEEDKRVLVCVATTAGVWAILSHESTVPGGGHVDGFLELSHLHRTGVDEVADLGAHLVAVIRDQVETWVIVINFRKVLGFFDVRRLPFGGFGLGWL